MHMKLRHHISECCDIQFVGLGDVLQCARSAVDLRHQLALLDLVKIDQIFDVRAARHQHQPGIIRVIDDKDARQRQIADVDRVLFELSVERPVVHVNPVYLSCTNHALALQK